jgi:hypothetical protein
MGQKQNKFFGAAPKFYLDNKFLKVARKIYFGPET